MSDLSGHGAQSEEIASLGEDRQSAVAQSARPAEGTRADLRDPEPRDPDPVEAEVAEPEVAESEVVESEPGVSISTPSPAVSGSAPAVPRPGDPPIAPPKPKSVTDTGKILEGVVTAVSADLVELTLDDGRPAVINRRNFGPNNEEPSAVLSPGDRAFGAELAREDPKSRVVLSRVWALKRKAWEKVEAAAENGDLVNGKVMSASGKGLVVDVGVRGFVPLSHLELEPVKDASSYVGQTLELKILEVDPRREKLVLSRRSLLLKAQRKEERELLHALKPGEVRSGTVVSLASYGAFVDVGGISGLVHISELSWQRVGKPSDVVTVGDVVEVKVLEVKTKKKRISLSIRQCSDDPLLALEVGNIETGRVTRLVDFGAFVSLGQFEGLVHLSELAEYRVSSPEEIVTPGDEVRVKILSIDPRRRRIELSIRRAAEYGG